ncbi:MAG TPA: patatin-like phospholipase family protein [Steroidobacteraceae bacterium]|nr:patatin-like phospholipase family protein [Steroidobacteraceae bacterium]
MGPEHDLGETSIERRNMLSLLGTLQLFRGLDASILAAIASEIEWFSLPGGASLFEAGDPPDALYMVISGCLGAFARTPDGHTRLVGRVMAGETVGEMALVSGKPRTASVHALRDTEIGRFSKQAFDALLLDHPQAMLRIAQLTVQRLENSQRQQRGKRSVPKTFTLLPHGPDIDVRSFAAELVKALDHGSRTELVWGARGATHTSHWFANIESQNDYVIYVADATPTSWSKLCLRQADALLLLANADAEPAPWQGLAAQRESRFTLQRAELVLLQESGVVRGGTHRWLAQHPGLAHHHVRSAADVRRIARLLTGRGVGLVMSGGGARGFAHIGVVKALREGGIPIDAVGGTSMGAILGAGVAMEWPHEVLVERFRRTFVDTNPLNDYTLPLVSLVSGRKVSGLLRQEFGEMQIEDLNLPFFCVSSNLSAGRIAVHRSGILWRWLRASVAIPGVLPPVFHKGEVHVDGGAMNNLPVDVMREVGRGHVIGVDVGADRAFTADFDDVDVPGLWKAMSWFRSKKNRVNIFQILWRAGMVNSAAATIAHREQTDVLLQPPLDNMDMLNWKGFERAIDMGYRYALDRLEKISGTVLSGPAQAPEGWGRIP